VTGKPKEPLWPERKASRIEVADLNAELDEHDDILIRLDDKASRTGIKVEKQNKDMSKILNKK